MRTYFIKLLSQPRTHYILEKKKKLKSKFIEWINREVIRKVEKYFMQNLYIIGKTPNSNHDPLLTFQQVLIAARLRLSLRTGKKGSRDKQSEM